MLRFLVIVIQVMVVVGEEQGTSLVYKGTNVNFCRFSPLNEIWMSSNELDCIRDCKLSYGDKFHNAIFNKQKSTCSAMTSEPKRDAPTTFDAGDTFYYEQDYQDPACDTSKGFQARTYCGISVCVYEAPVAVNYTTAKEDCESRNATIFMPNSYARLMLFMNAMAFRATWIGLVRTAAGATTFVWENGDPLDGADFDSTWFWVWNQPDNWDGSQDCTTCYHKRLDPMDRVRDIACSELQFYFCEPDNTI